MEIVYTVDGRSKGEKLKGAINAVTRGVNTAWKATKTVVGVVFVTGFVVGAATMLPTTMAGMNSNNNEKETNT